MDDCELRRVFDLVEFWTRGEKPRQSSDKELTEAEVRHVQAYPGLERTPLTDEMRETIRWAEEEKSRMKVN